MGVPLAEPLQTESDDSTPPVRHAWITVGVILLLASIALLWWNEGRTDVSKLARQSKQVAADAVDKAADGKLISVTGELGSEELLGDPGFLAFGPYITLDRKTEMYAWIEQESTIAIVKLGGRKEYKQKFTYQREWTDTPPNSDSFAEPEDHKNPTLSIQRRSYTVKEASIGAYRFYPGSADLPTGSPVAISDENYLPSYDAVRRGDCLFIGEGTIEDPVVGDMRISYTAIESGVRATLFGRLNGGAIEPYFHRKKIRLYQLAAGARGDAIAQMPASVENESWMLRLAGLLMMWTGLCLCFESSHSMLDLAPALKVAGRPMIVAAMALAAVGMLLLVALASSIAHHVLVLGVVLATPCGGVWMLARKRHRARTARVQSSTDERKTLPLQDAHVRRPSTGEGKEPVQAHEPEGKESVWPPKAKAKDVAGEIKFECENCGARYAVPTSFGGRKARCRKCKHKFYIPPASVDAEPPPTVMDPSSEQASPEDD